MTVREECYDRIKKHMHSVVRLYYEQHPERLWDARGTEAMTVSQDGLEAILKILDEYEIEPRE